MEKHGFVYIMASSRNGTLYLGVTIDLPKRAWEHREGLVDGFTKKHCCKLLVWYEAYESLDAARLRERQMKEWQRAWKIREIEGLNPDWNDLFDRLTPSRDHRNWAPAFAGEQKNICAE
ncbi:GIY-YIG nuclease family protein [Sphingomonas sp. R-74633]|uniref:GIY-YIG nuclease family protein n=1 Tax=Sphingomonas sp. R-74633 TaxID=2751188 RepID=UPI0015D23AC7|nr:GIY-YIG nuclease family protein [Sphingomonas sp. R-74633]NYT40029.1 GIY-YIG nuclease family protein [Sphingomonas sp. R-74633]